ncbi:MAG TPA: GtrA family protein [Polyangia bacterium]
MKALTRASLASLAATGLELALLPLLIHVLHFEQWISYAVVQLFANAVTFVLYKFWAFEARHGSTRAQYLKQLVIFGGSLCLNTAIPSFLSYRLHVEPVVAFALSNVFVYLSWNYPGNRFWVFRRDVR